MMYIHYEQRGYHYARLIKGDGKLGQSKKYTERGFMDFCKTAMSKGDHVMSLPEKPKEDLEFKVKR